MRPTVQQPLTVAAVPFALFPFWRPLLTEDPVMAATVEKEDKFLKIIEYLLLFFDNLTKKFTELKHITQA